MTPANFARSRFGVGGARAWAGSAGWLALGYWLVSIVVIGSLFALHRFEFDAIVFYVPVLISVIGAMVMAWVGHMVGQFTRSREPDVEAVVVMATMAATAAACLCGFLALRGLGLVSGALAIAGLGLVTHVVITRRLTTLLS